MQSVLAIDQSTSATKAVWIDGEGEVAERASRVHRQYYPQPGWVEHDAEEIWANVLAVTGEIIGRRAANAQVPAYISLANQRETVVVFDRASGEPLAPAIVWQCRRGDALCAEMVRSGQAAQIRGRTGLRVDGYFSAPKLQWLIRERRDLVSRIKAGTALVGTMDTYLVYRLTQGAVFATDHTNASRTLLYNIRDLSWDAELCGLWEVPARALAEVRSSDARFGTTTLDGRLSTAVPIAGVMGDSQAAMFAHRCLHRGSAKATFGTGSSILVNAGQRIPQGLEGTLLGLAWVRQGKPTYALEGIIISCAATLNWLQDQLKVLPSAADCEHMVEQVVAGASGIYLVPAFSGLGAPYWNERARAAIVGLSAHSDARHIVRAAIESIAYQLRDVVEMIRGECNIGIDYVQCDGGPTINAVLMQFAADLLDVELRVSTRNDLAARGAAMMGLSCLGEPLPDDHWSTVAPSARNYRRRADPVRMDDIYRGWRRAVAQIAQLT